MNGVPDGCLPGRYDGRRFCRYCAPAADPADTTSWRPWYRHKHTASFADALAALRRNLWRQRITAMSANPALQAKITSTLLDVLAEAA